MTIVLKVEYGRWTLPGRAVFAPSPPTPSAHLKYAAVQVGVDMLLCAVAVALTMAKLEFRRYQDIQPQEAAEFARMLEMYLYSSKTQEQNQQRASKLAAAFSGGIGALLKFVYKVACKLPRCSNFARCLLNIASSG